jgi:glycosyltransferase involved in cell wall biosynthesis
VKFLLKKDNWRNWQAPESATWGSEYLSLKSVKIGEFDLVPSYRGSKRVLGGIDVVVMGGWEAPFFIKTIFRAKKKLIPIIQFYESTKGSHRFSGPLIRKIRFIIFSQADFIVTAGTASTEAVLNTGIAKEKIITLFNPVDVSWFDSFARSHRIAPTPGHRFLYVGQLIARKNVGALIQAFALIKQGDDRLLIAGDGPLLDELKATAASLGVDKAVDFLGHKNQEELATIYASSNTFILPSTNEVWGLVVNEALASGLHAVVSDKCGVADFVENMPGCYITPTDPRSLAEAMAKSRENWNGYIDSPQILEYTPERFADEIVKVVERVWERSNQIRLTWLTNIPAPYRIPVWEALDARSRFNLVFLNKTERGRNWNLSKELAGLSIRILGTKAIYLGDNTPLYLNFFKGNKLLRKLNSDAIYIDGWESPAFFIRGIMAKRATTTVIYGYRSTIASHRFSGPLIRKIRFIIFSQADFIVTAGTASTEAVLNTGIAKEKIITLFNPVDVSWFDSFARSHRIAPTPGHRFLYVGQLIARKNVGALIQAFALIKQGDDRLLIAGDGPLLDELKATAASLGVDKAVDFLGHKNQEELATIYASSNTFILPSTNEVWGLVVNEALASGLHVIVTDKCGVSEFVQNMQGAFICGTDQKSLQEAMSESSRQWNGYIEEPEILKYTPERFADGVIANLSNFGYVYLQNTKPTS